MLFVLRNERGRLCFLVHPNLRTVVREEHLDYFRCLLADFLERANLHPAELFKQVSSLGVGRLVTQEVGYCLSEFPHLLEISSQFVKL